MALDGFLLLAWRMTEFLFFKIPQIHNYTSFVHQNEYLVRIRVRERA